MLKIAVCDDNAKFLKYFHGMIDTSLKTANTNAELFDYTSGKVLINHLNFERFDAAFLDIDMPELSGFDIAKELSKVADNCKIIFVTSHSELVYDSFLFTPLNFIPKSDETEMERKLDIVIKQLLESLKQNKTVILENKENGRISVRLRDVLYIESNKHNVIYHILGQKDTVTVSDSLLNLEQEYAEYDFVRTHKKYLVNLSHIFNISLTREIVIFKEKFELPLSRNYKITVDKRLTEYLRRE